jgi:hypothetical protein
MCRRKIKHAEAVDFTYKYVETETELKQVYDLFTKVGNKKILSTELIKVIKKFMIMAKSMICVLFILLC